MSSVLISVIVWRAAALAVWLIIAVGTVEVVVHVVRGQRHRPRTK